MSEGNLGRDPFGSADRRRFPRHVPGHDLTLTLPNVIDAEILDISTSGALLSSSVPLKVGQRGGLRTLLGREPFSAWFEVRRAEEGTLGARHRLGVTFTALPEQAQRTLQNFVKADERQG